MQVQRCAKKNEHDFRCRRKAKHEGTCSFELYDPNRLYMNEVALKLDRRPATIRMWERVGWVPVKLRSRRSKRGWRYWTPKQVEGLQAWMLRRDIRPGRGLAHYHPTPEQIKHHLAGQRAPRKRITAPV